MEVGLSRKKQVLRILGLPPHAFDTPRDTSNIDRLFTPVAYHRNARLVRKSRPLFFYSSFLPMSDAPFHPLDNSSAWAEARTRSMNEPVLIFKHSSACSVSASAEDDMRSLAAETDVPVYKLVVQQSRALSNEIAESLGVRHETPQALVLVGGEAVFDTSHFDVTAETVQDALRTARAVG
jgi:bacillithiol system protein YtxJ